MTTLVTALERAAQSEASVRFLDRFDNETRLTWAEIQTRAESTARRLRAFGVDPGDTVALIFPTGPEFFDACFGALLAGAVPVPLYPPLRLGRLAEYQHRTTRMIEACGADLVLADATVAKVLGEAVAPTDARLSTLADLPAASGGIDLIDPVDENALALVQFSSGTTIDPKPVALSHGSILRHVETLNKLWPAPIEGQHAAVSWLPLYHDMGLIGFVFGAMELRCDLTLMPPEAFVAQPIQWLRAISSSRATISAAPNFAYALTAQRVREAEMEGVDLSSWQVALNGAESVSPRVARRFVERFAGSGFRAEAMTPVYGLAEATLAVTFSSMSAPFRSEFFSRNELTENGRAVDDLGGREIASVGRPIPGVELEIRSVDGNQLPPGQVGTVFVKSGSVMSGYLNRPEATAAVISDGWLDTGDLGFLRADELYLVGRAKDVVIIRGRNYSPEEFERAIDGLWGVRSGCSAAVSHFEEGNDREHLLLFVEMRKDLGRTERMALEERCVAAVMAATGVPPDEVISLEPGTLPRTSSGKLRRSETLRRWLSDELTAPRRPGPVGLLLAMLRSRLALRRRGRQRPS